MVRDDGAVDLHLVEGESQHIGERGIAGAEIVERKAYAEFAQSVQDFEIMGVVGQEQRFCDLEFEA